MIPTIEKIEWETGWGRIETALAGPSDEQLADALFKVFGHKPVCTKLWDEWYQVAADIPWEDRCSPDFREPQPCKGECRIEDARLLQKALEGRA